MKTVPFAPLALIEPELASQIIFWLGWLMVAIGALKLSFYVIGEINPSAWSRIKSPSVRKIFTGTGNRLLFGLGGLLTVLFGLASVGVAILIRKLV